MGQIEKRLEKLGIQLPTPPKKAGLYAQTRRMGCAVYVSGCGPDLNGVEKYKGRLGVLSMEDGQKAARQCVLNALAILQRELGTLDRVKGVMKMLVFVASERDFWEQPLVANGASQLLMDVFGEECGCPTRSAVGMWVLPGDIPVEIEMMVQIEE